MLLQTNVKSWVENEAKDVVYIVEANSFERMTLWRTYKDHWKDVTNGGPMPTVGRINDRPVVLSMTVVKIKGKDVLFIEATSQLVDWLLIEAFLKHCWPERRKVDAGNFHSVVSHIDHLLEQEAAK